MLAKFGGAVYSVARLLWTSGWRERHVSANYLRDTRFQ